MWGWRTDMSTSSSWRKTRWRRSLLRCTLTAPRREEVSDARYTVLNPPWPITRDEKPPVTDSTSAHSSRLARPLLPDADPPLGSAETRGSVWPASCVSRSPRRRQSNSPHPGNIARAAGTHHTHTVRARGASLMEIPTGILIEKALFPSLLLQGRSAYISLWLRSGDACARERGRVKEWALESVVIYASCQLSGAPLIIVRKERFGLL